MKPKKLSMEELHKVAGGTYTDEFKVCIGCGKTFVFTAGEQEYYATKGTTIEYCKECRDSNKVNKKTITVYESVCPGCEGIFKVPFKPTPDQVIYCSECFSSLSSQ